MKQGAKTLGKLAYLALKGRKLKSSDPRTREKASHFLASFLGDERGLFRKYAQVLNQNKQQSEQLKDLHFAKDQLLSIQQVEGILREEGILDKLEYLNPQGISASIGQVHSARLKDGQEVVLKIKYPGLEKELSAQLQILNLLPKLNRFSPMGKQDFDADSFSRELIDLLEQELDFEREVQALEALYHKTYPFKPNSPRVIKDLSNANVICMEALSGQTISGLKEESPVLQKKVCENLVASVLSSLLNAGTYQQDPNWGNFFYNEDGQVSFLDFGSIIQAIDGQAEALCKIIYALRRGDFACVEENAQALGFQEDLKVKLQAPLALVFHTLFAPFLTNSHFDMQEWRISEIFQETLADDKWSFRSSGNFSFFTLMKGWWGVAQIVKNQSVRLNYFQLFDEVVSKTPFYESKQKAADRKVLRVEIFHNQQRLHFIELPYASLLELRQWIPSDVLASLSKTPEQYVKEYLAKNLESGLVFEEKTETRVYRVSVHSL